MFEALSRRVLTHFKGATYIGVGTGRTVEGVLRALVPLISADKQSLRFVCSSLDSQLLCHELGLTTIDLMTIKRVDCYFDGADEVDAVKNLLKGRGAALLKEHILAAMAAQFLVVVDNSKFVAKLGEKYPLPIEVMPAAKSLVTAELFNLGAKTVEARGASGGKHGLVITESGNIILDATYDLIDSKLALAIKQLPGVLETGFFAGTRVTEVLKVTL